MNPQQSSPAEHGPEVAVQADAAIMVPHQQGGLSAREEALHSREDAVILREEALRAREDAARTSADVERLMGQMREANERLIVAALQAQTLSEETRKEAARAETEIARLMGHVREANERLVAATAHAQTMAERAQTMAEEADHANRLKDEFLGTISHELRTPLNAILGYARMLHNGTVTRDREARAAEIIERNATALTQIVEDVLDVSRIISGGTRLNVQRVELAAVVNEAIETVRPTADAKGVRVLTVVDPRHPIVSGDPARLQQVVWNLLSNAVKFTPSEGRIHLWLERTNSHVEIVVRDTGRGIRPDFLPHVFERFRQADGRVSREYNGLGLGLAISRHLVELHGGTIHAASDGEGTGATFRVRLPMTNVQTAPEGEPTRGHPRPEPGGGDTTRARLDGIHVLAVDDEEDSLTLLREILETAGAQVTTVASSQEALDAVEKMAPGVIIADIGLPRMDGFALIRRIRQWPERSIREIPAAALTAYARSEDRQRALRSGFQMHLAKPIDPGELVAAVAAIARHQPVDT
jgi:signal transduction histidine kinase/ActR/RegA family two-component response regulator